MCVHQALYEAGISGALSTESLKEQKEFARLLDSQQQSDRLIQLRGKYPRFEQQYYETL